MNLPSLDAIKAIVGDAKIAFTDAMILIHAIPAVKAGVANGESALGVLKNQAPEALAIIESVANIVAPGSGEIIQLLATAYAHSRPMTRDEEEAWFQRASRE